jgi:hypothetical protein
MSDELVDFNEIPFVEDGSPIIIDYNRPIVKIPRVPPLPKEVKAPYRSETIEYGYKYYNYMVANFNEMFDGDSIVKHFDIIGYMYDGLADEAEEICQIYGVDIQKNLNTWIHKEHGHNRLFDEANWKPFRDMDVLTHVYLNYNRLFKYENNYFQLIIDDWCGTCTYCVDNSDIIHFKLLFRGSTDKNPNQFLHSPFITDISNGDIIDTSTAWELKGGVDTTLILSKQH